MRKPVADDNPLLVLQTKASEQITSGLDAYRVARDKLEEQMFFGFYGSPFVQAFLGITADSIVRPVPITSSEKLVARQAQTDAYEAMVETGGFDEALTRAVLYVLAANRMLDQRCALALNVARQQLMRLSLAEFKILVRDQYLRSPARTRTSDRGASFSCSGHGGPEGPTGAGARDHRRWRPSD